MTGNYWSTGETGWIKSPATSDAYASYQDPSGLDLDAIGPTSPR